MKKKTYNCPICNEQVETTRTDHICKRCGSYIDINELIEGETK